MKIDENLLDLIETDNKNEDGDDDDDDDDEETCIRITKITFSDNLFRFLKSLMLVWDDEDYKLTISNDAWNAVKFEEYDGYVFDYDEDGNEYKMKKTFC